MNPVVFNFGTLHPAADLDCAADNPDGNRSNAQPNSAASSLDSSQPFYPKDVESDNWLNATRVEMLFSNRRSGLKGLLRVANINVCLAELGRVYKISPANRNSGAIES